MSLLLPLLFACKGPDTVPAWAWDPIWLEPLDGGAHGFQTWQLYGERWADGYDDKHYVCAVVVELYGAPVTCDAEPECTTAWDFGQGTVLETDCADPSIADDPLFTSVTRVGLGAPVSGDEIPWPGLTSVGWVDYGGGWEVHGTAWPEALDLGRSVTSGEWDGVEPFQFVPEQAFPWPPAR